MTCGALIFAFNNEQTNYINMAAWSAERIHRHLDMPVAVVTNDPESAARDGRFDQIIAAEVCTGGTRWFEDYQSSVTWHNAGRVDAYSLSPWDRTLVLDADYVVASSDLKQIVDCDTDFLCFANAYNIANPDQEFLTKFGKFGMPMYWATVMLFRQSTIADWIFESMTMIRNNWQHYRALYGINETNYRNDYALSIALALVNGSNPYVDAIPWSMASVLPDQRLSVNTDHNVEIWNVQYINQHNKPHTVGISGMDLHAMGKRDLGDIIAGRTRLLDTGIQH